MAQHQLNQLNLCYQYFRVFFSSVKKLFHVHLIFKTCYPYMAALKARAANSWALLAFGGAEHTAQAEVRTQIWATWLQRSPGSLTLVASTVPRCVCAVLARTEAQMQCNNTVLPLGSHIVTIKADRTQFLHAEKPVLFLHSLYFIGNIRRHSVKSNWHTIHWNSVCSLVSGLYVCPPNPSVPGYFTYFVHWFPWDGLLLFTFLLLSSVPG